MPPGPWCPPPPCGVSVLDSSGRVLGCSRRRMADLAEHRFVGRERELEALTARLADARAGRGRLVLLVGEPGIGKTRIAEELIARAATSNDRILWGRCAEQEGAPAYWPWVQ